MSILIVDDDPSIQIFFKKTLEYNGFQVIGPANNGIEALELYKNSFIKPDLIFMDHRMPLKDGLEASKEIFDLDQQAKIIFITADETVKETALDIGILKVLSKPFGIKDLVNIAKKYIDI